MSSDSVAAAPAELKPKEPDPRLVVFAEATRELDRRKKWFDNFKREYAAETKALRADIPRLLAEAASISKDEDERRAYAGWLYLNVQHIGMMLIAAGFGFKSNHKFREWMGDCDTGFECESCKGQVRVRHRDDFEALKRKVGVPRKAPSGRYSYDNIICKKCKDHLDRLQQMAREAKREQLSREAEQRREEELRTMPYRDYLRTEEWDKTRRAALSRAGYRCQLCNAGKVSLHVHHRTYERRGCEHNSDLIVLCADCHRTFHEKSELKD